MNAPFLAECFAVLSRTPAVLDALLRDLPETFTAATEGEGTWSPYDVVGHLIHGERTDWLPRVEVIIQHGSRQPFAPFERASQSTGPLPALLDEFSNLRRANLRRLRELNLQPAQLELPGTHPALGPVTLKQLLATWTAHDLAHLVQVTRVMAKCYRHQVGPWAEYLSVMK